MLTIKQITEDTNAIIQGLEKKHFKQAKETIEQVLEANNRRRNSQNLLDNNLAEVNALSR
ncbi:MAG: serine--tRNA ligase, partial [Bacteroides sp.]|nr:serine--tRNA ligase [Bacteroides sp.]